MSGQTWGSGGGQPYGRPPQQNVGAPAPQAWGRPGQFGPPQAARGQFPHVQFGQSPLPQPPSRQGGPGGGWQDQQPRKGSLLGRMLIITAGLAVAALVALAVIGLTRSGDVAYVNEGYTPPPADSSPPPLPEPASEQEAVNYLEANPVYDQVMPAPVRCDGVAEIDLETISNEDLETHLENMMGCLVAAWHEPIEAAGFQMPRPPVTVYTDDNLVSTACGDSKPGNATYCGADQAIYYSADLHETAPFLLDARYGAEGVIAHEFAHAVQGRTGILISKLAMMQLAESDEEAYELNRRNEAQADCFAGLFLLSASTSLGIDDAEYENLATVFERIGGPEADPESTHPYGPSRTYWMRMGLSTDALGQCNTYTAPSEYVR